MKKVILSVFAAVMIFSASGSEDIHVSPYEVIRDLGGRHIRIASPWPYLPFRPATELDRMLHDQMRRISYEYNIFFSEILIDHGDIMPTLRSSVMSGRPFADIVMLGGDMVLPAITGNLIYALEEFVPHDSPLWGEHPSTLRPSASFLDFYWTFAPHALNLEGMFLGVNMGIIRGIGAADPLDLYEKGEWTFEHFREIMIQATQAGEGWFGISGSPGDIITHLIAANDGVMVREFRYAYDDPYTITALDFAYNILQTDRTWQYEHGIHNRQENLFAFLDGRSAFFPISEWVLQQTEITFDHIIIPFPKGPDNERHYTFMKGFDMGLAVPRGTPNPGDVYTIFEGISQWAAGDAGLVLERDQANLAGVFPSEGDFLRANRIMQEQGKFDMGLAVSTFSWMNGFLAEGFMNGDINVTVGIERFRQPQQNILDVALENWLLH